VAQTLLYGQVTLDTFDAPALANPAARALARKVFVRGDPDFTTRRPESRLARVSACFRDGRRLSELAEINEQDPQNQLPLAKVHEKCFGLARDRLGMEKAMQLNRLLNDLERLENVRDLTKVLTL